MWSIKIILHKQNAMMESPGLDKINEQIDEVVQERFGSLFRFRPKQKEAVAETIDAWLNGISDVIMSAPTGSGKSITALTIAAVLTKYYNMNGYILASDLNLIEQYRNDVNKYFPDWQVIKGQQQYKCERNGLPFTSGYCKLKGCKSYGDIRKKFPDCYTTCEYIVDREKAMKSKLLVCTYSFWLIQMNLVKEMLGEDAPFRTRNFVICDEAHKLMSIVQSHFSPKFSERDFEKMKLIADNGMDEDGDTYIGNVKNIRYKIGAANDQQVIYDLLCQYLEEMKIFVDAIDTIKRDISLRTDNDEPLSAEDKQLANCCDFLDNHIQAFSDYVKIIEIIGSTNLIKNFDDAKRDEITFNCIDESYLMQKHFHNHCQNKMYMSATIGEHSAFAKDCAFVAYKGIDIPSTFDFTNSPIFYIPDYRMSYKEKDMSFPRTAELIEATIDMYAGKRGIIQTGSYQFAKKLLDYIDPVVSRRLILYDDTKEKTEALDYFKRCDDKILVGPSLIEGLSFDDDLCRFQIIMKVPYPSLADKFVSAKKDIKPEWYNNTTAISILQGVGRGIRNDHDWCVTFIFDGCFTYLAGNASYMFPDEFKKRIQIIPAQSILQYKNQKN